MLIKTTFRSLLELTTIEISCKFDTSFLMVLFPKSMFFSIIKIPFIYKLFIDELPLPMIVSFFQESNILFMILVVSDIKFASFFPISKSTFIDDLIIKKYLDSITIFLSIKKLSIIYLLCIEEEESLIFLVLVELLSKINTIFKFFDQWALYMNFAHFEQTLKKLENLSCLTIFCQCCWIVAVFDEQFFIYIFDLFIGSHFGVQFVLVEWIFFGEFQHWCIICLRWKSLLLLLFFVGIYYFVHVRNILEIREFASHYRLLLCLFLLFLDWLLDCLLLLFYVFVFKGVFQAVCSLSERFGWNCVGLAVKDISSCNAPSRFQSYRIIFINLAGWW